MSTIAQVQPGTRSAGLMTTVLPQASAGAIFQAGIAIGKFQGVISPTGPTASRVISTPTPGRTEGRISPDSRRHSPAKKSKICAARTVSPIPSASVLPSSRESRVPISSLRAVISSAAFLQHRVALERPGPAPGRERRLGRRDRPLGIGGGRAGVVADHLGGVRRVDVRHRLALDPVPVDQVCVQLHCDLPRVVLIY